MDFNDYVASLGLDRETLTVDQTTALQAAWRRSERAPFASAVEDISDLVANAIERHPSQREALAAVPELAAANGWDTQRVRREILERGHGQASGLHIPANSPNEPLQAEAMAVSLALSSGLSEQHVRKWNVDQRTVDFAMSKGMRGLTLQGLFRACLQAAGRHVPMGALSNQHIRDAMHISQAMASVGPSTISVAGILGNVANKGLMAAYTGTPVTWPKWCGTGSVKNFHEQTVYRMTADGTVSEVPAGGQIEHISLEESSESNQAKTYAAMLGLDRKQIINDDLSAFAAVPGILGRQATISLEKAVFTKLLSNTGNFFHTTNGNIKTGAGSALALAGLNDANASMAAQLDGNGDPLFLTPSLLLVPPALTPTARSLTNSIAIIDGTATATQPDANPWRGLFSVVEGPYLGTAAGLTNASNAGWYLLCAPSDFSVVNVVFLNGQQSPQVESAEMDFDRLGMLWRVVFDYGVAYHDHRGGVFNAGS
jgi:hypothetical protein